MGECIDNANSDEAAPNDDETHSSQPTVGRLCEQHGNVDGAQNNCATFGNSEVECGVCNTSNVALCSEHYPSAANEAQQSCEKNRGLIPALVQ
jgi:hypothetical protein